MVNTLPGALACHLVVFKEHRNRQLRVVHQHRLRHPAEEGKGRHEPNQ